MKINYYRGDEFGFTLAQQWLADEIRTNGYAEQAVNPYGMLPNFTARTFGLKRTTKMRAGIAVNVYVIKDKERFEECLEQLN